ncbi:hypothetical protein L210DRAFT_954833 [Boletus edulis BED1]|uniref:Uncharacterized protein n=1 Tax=Boletus edulis BED1 TaxID=1328754 RepID=A0AAD4BDF8_BOLED|nr:hypothetical protein L210DRAFT_954833 [Boletus edulis BED1]
MGNSIPESRHCLTDQRRVRGPACWSSFSSSAAFECSRNDLNDQVTTGELYQYGRLSLVHEWDESIVLCLPPDLPWVSKPSTLRLK